MTQASNVGILTPKINSSGQLDATTGLTGAVPVANGGTGAATYTANNVLLGNGTSAFQTVAPSTNGNVLTSNGTTWVSSAPAGGGGLGGQTVFTSNGTFTIPSGKTVVKVIVQAGGGSTGGGSNSAGGGGCAIKYLTGLTPGNTLTVTVGSGGTAGVSSSGNTGGTSSVASGTQTITTITATGGSGGTGVIASNSPGGTGSNGDYNIPGGTGAGLRELCGNYWSQGSAGSGFMSNSAASEGASGGSPWAGKAGLLYGGGAAGNYGNSGLAGGAGIVIFEY